MIKKYLTIILSLAILLSAATVCAVDDKSYYSNGELESFERSVDFYTHFGITEKKTASSTVTRREFAKTAMAYFYGEMSGNNLSAAASFYGKELSDEELDKDITFGEALKCMAMGLGYGKTADNLIGTAYNIGVAKGISADTSMPVTFFNVVKMLDNSLEIKRIEGSLTESGNYEITNNTILNSVLKIERKHGTVTAVNGMSLTSRKVGKGRIDIDGTVYETDCVTDKSVVGCSVDYYIDLNNRETVKFIDTASKYNIITEYDAEDLISYGSRKYRVKINDDKEKTISLDSSAYIIYNGRPAKNITAKSMVPNIGRVVMTDNDKDGDAEVVSVYSFDIKIISTVDEANNRVLFKDGSKAELENEDDFSITKNGSAEELQIKALKSENVVLFGKNDDGGVLIELLPKSITGTLNVSDDENMTIDGIIYPVMPNAYYEKQIKTGECGTFWIDCDNRVAAVVKVSTQLRYGYLINAVLKSDIADRAEVKILDDGGQMRILETAPKINVDGKSLNSAAFLNELKKGGTEVQSQLIYFSVNDKGELRMADTAYNYSVAEDYRSILPKGEDNEKSFKLVYSSTLQNEGTVLYFPRMKTFDGRFGGSGSQKVFMVPNNPKTAKNEDFGVRSLSGLSEQYYNVDAYTFGSKKFTPDVYVIYGGKNAAGANAYMGIISEITDIADEDGETAQRIVAYGPPDVNLNLLNYDVDLSSVPAYYDGTKRYKTDVGDIAIIHYSEGELTSIEMVLDAESGNFSRNFNSYGRYWRMDYGAVYEKEGSMITVAPLDRIAAIETLKAQLETAPETEVQSIKNKIEKIEREFIVYCTSDFRQIGAKVKENGKIKVSASPKNLYIPYSDSTEHYTKVLVCSSEAYAWTMFAYENN